MKRIILIIIVIATIAVGGYFVLQQIQGAAEDVSEGAPLADPNTIAFSTGVAVVTAEGQVVPGRFANLSLLTSGEIVEILAVEDEFVNEGDPLLRLDTAEQEIGLQQARAGLAQTEANLQAALAGVAAAEVRLASAAVNIRAAEAALALAQADPTAEQIALSEAAVKVAEANISAAAGSQSLTLEGPTEAALRAAEAQIIAAQAQQKPVQDALGTAIRFELPDDTVADIRLQYNATVANVQAAEAALAELDSGATNAERVAAGNAVSGAQSQRDAAEAQVALLRAGALPEQVAIAEAGVARAIARKTEAEIGLQQAETAVAQAEAAVQQSEAFVRSAEEALNQRILSAPFDGTVTTINGELGEIAAAGVPVVTLVDLTSWLVETTDLTELDVVAIAVGHAAEVTVDALPDVTLAGVVTDIGRLSDLSRGDVTYQVQIRLEDAQSVPLRWGMTTEVEIETGESS